MRALQAPVEERLRMAALLGHEEAQREQAGEEWGALWADTVNPLPEVVERRWGPLAAAACVRGAWNEMARVWRPKLRLREDEFDMVSSHAAWALAVSRLGEDRAREAARQAGIRWALGVG